MMMKTVSAEAVKQRAAEMGAQLCGIAAAERFADAPAGFHPADVLAGCASVIIIAARFPAGALTGPSAAAYTFAILRSAEEVDAITFNMAQELEGLGCIALAVPARDPYDYWDDSRRHGQGILSLKHAAVRAGLGRMGKNTLLVNDRLGNRLSLGAILVDRELAADPLAGYETCPAGCRICLDACPVGALDSTTIEQRKCRAHSGRQTAGGGFVYGCNLCRRSCPVSAGLK